MSEGGSERTPAVKAEDEALDKIARDYGEIPAETRDAIYEMRNRWEAVERYDSGLPFRHVVECEVCGERYHVAADHELSKVTLKECDNCGDYSPWALVETTDHKNTDSDREGPQ